MSYFFLALLYHGDLIISLVGSLLFFLSLDLLFDLEDGFDCFALELDFELFILLADLLLTPDLFKDFYYLDVIDPLIID